MKWLHNISFKLFLICFVFVFFAVSILEALSYRYIKHEITQSRLDSARMTLLKEEQYLNLYFLTLQNTLSSLSSSIEALPPQEEALGSLLTRFYDRNATLLSDMYVIRRDLSVIGGGIVSSAFNEPSPERQALYDSIYERPYAVTISPLYKSVLSGWTVSFAMPLSFAGEPMALAMDLSLSALEQKLAEISGRSDLSLGILDLQGQVIALPLNASSVTAVNRDMSIAGMTSQELVTSANDIMEISRGETALTILKTIDHQYQWVIFAIADNTRLQRSLHSMNLYFAGLLALGMMLSLALALFVARYIRVPVHYLIRKMQLVRSGNLQVSVSHARRDEFGELALSFDDMLGQLRRLIENLNRTERFKKEMEIEVLQSQINPHFLYNTLGSISNAVASGRHNDVDPVIEALIAILEYGITNFSEKVALEEELRNVRNYLYIQNIRYDCVFDWTEEIEEGLLDYPVLKMILQPIVENSIFHGYNGGRIPGGIAITACRRQGHVVVEVRDSGCGIAAHKLPGLLAPGPKEGVHPRNRKRIGLYNIDQRIRLYYGPEYGVQVESTPDEGTCVRLVFPGEGNGRPMEEDKGCVK
ncbi:MAG: hypothetical protein K0R57_5541 [Paenibacillaceae bacterium]|jgi:two-component system sensor histidine kinase YesM|nr:hypothetical protein [Paenibacillaceae bacterium]